MIHDNLYDKLSHFNYEHFKRMNECSGPSLSPSFIARAALCVPMRRGRVRHT